MIRTADLTGAQLDYHTARAQGVPAERLEIRRVPRTDTLICVKQHKKNYIHRYAVSTDWHMSGELMKQHRMFVGPEFNIPDHLTWKAKPQFGVLSASGPTPQVAICRAVVRAAFGEEVEEVAVCE